MVKKIIACSDIHIRGLKRLQESYEVLSNFIKVVKEEIGDNNPEEYRIVVAGDIFDNKITITNESNLAVGWFIRELNSIAKTIVIAGNHDYLASNTERVDSITPIFQIGDYSNSTYLDMDLNYMSGCKVDDNITWCLYSTFDGFTRPDIAAEKKLNPDNKFIGLIHGDINGAKTDTGFVTDKGIDKSIFKGLDFVIAGHIHKYQELKYGKTPVVYCSSLIQQNNGENIEGHGYIVWNLEDNTYEFKELPNPDYGYYCYTIDNVDDIKNDKEILINC